MSTSTVIELFGWRLLRVFLIIIDLSIVEVHVQCIFCDIPKEKKTADRIRSGVYYWTLEESNVLRREYRRGMSSLRNLRNFINQSIVFWKMKSSLSICSYANSWSVIICIIMKLLCFNRITSFWNGEENIEFWTKTVSLSKRSNRLRCTSTRPTWSRKNLIIPFFSWSG